MTRLTDDRDVHPAAVIIQNEVPVTHETLAQRSQALAERLRALRATRVAIATDRADRIATSLLAARQANCGLLLLREQFPRDSEIWEQWAVDCVVDEDMAVHPLGEPGRSTAEFCILLTTSGTTGTPKVARHSLERLLGRVRPPRHQEHDESTWLLTFHPATFAGMQVLLTTLANGYRLVARSAPTAVSLAEAALAHRPTHVSGTPTFWRAFMIALGSRASELVMEQITLGGEAVDQPTLDRLKGTFPKARVIHIYASTEAGSLFAVRDGRAGFPASWLEQPVDGVSLRVREDILQVRSPRAMRDYVGRSASSPVAEDGWLDTKDRVSVSGDRVLFLGRDDSVINVGGAKASPEAIEAVLLEVAGVADVRVVGASNPITGQIVTAEVRLHEGCSEDAVRAALLEHARGRLQSHEVPRLLKFVSTIAFTQSGKKSRA